MLAAVAKDMLAADIPEVRIPEEHTPVEGNLLGDTLVDMPAVDNLEGGERSQGTGRCSSSWQPHVKTVQTQDERVGKGEILTEVSKKTKKKEQYPEATTVQTQYEEIKGETCYSDGGLQTQEEREGREETVTQC